MKKTVSNLIKRDILSFLFFCIDRESSVQDILKSGQLQHVRYIPKSMGKDVDELLEPYVETGAVSLVADNDPVCPETVFIEPQFFVNGKVVDNNWGMYNS